MRERVETRCAGGKADNDPIFPGRRQPCPYFTLARGLGEREFEHDFATLCGWRQFDERHAVVAFYAPGLAM
ncbi:MAG: hypothetical protein IPG56_13035 [Caulobacteraceae bacterium]|nr:hypothetical protein [Caulobacteraceae bacterium]